MMGPEEDKQLVRVTPQTGCTGCMHLLHSIQRWRVSGCRRLMDSIQAIAAGTALLNAAARRCSCHLSIQFASPVSNDYIVSTSELLPMVIHTCQIFGRYTVTVDAYHLPTHSSPDKKGICLSLSLSLSLDGRR